MIIYMTSYIEQIDEIVKKIDIRCLFQLTLVSSIGIAVCDDAGEVTGVVVAAAAIMIEHKYIMH